MKGGAYISDNTKYIIWRIFCWAVVAISLVEACFVWFFNWQPSMSHVGVTNLYLALFAYILAHIEFVSDKD